MESGFWWAVANHVLGGLLLVFVLWLFKIPKTLQKIVRESHEQKIILLEMIESMDRIKSSVLILLKRASVTDRAISDLSGSAFDSQSIIRDGMKYPKIKIKKDPNREH